MARAKNLILLFPALIVSFVRAETPFYARFAITQGDARVGENFTLTLTINALIDIPDLRVVFEIPNGIEILSDTLSKTLNLSSGNSTDLPLRLSITQPGPYQITAHIVIAPKDTIYFLQRLVKDFYIISDSANATYSESPVEGVYYNLLSEQIIGEIPSEPPPPLTTYTLSGTVCYRNKLTHQLDPLADILIKLIDRVTGQVVASAHTNSSGSYSITVNPGKYTLIIFAQNYAGEVHRFWKGVARWYGDCDLYCSEPAYWFLNQAVNLYNNMTVNYNAEAGRADWARILWRIQREKNWMYNHTSPHRSLDYIEVCYPAVSTITINRPWPWPDTTITYKAPKTAFYVYFAKLEAVKFKIESAMPPWWPWPWWGLGVHYRNPHQIVIHKYNEIWDPSGAIGGLSHEWTHGLMVSTLGGKVPYGWGHAIHYLNSVINRGHAFSEGFAEFCAPAMWVAEAGQNIGTLALEYFYANPRFGKDFPYYRGRDTLNTDGSFVEGSVFQFLWDLFDDRNTNDHEPNFDDDGVYGGMAKIMNTLASLGTIMTVETSDWDTLGKGSDSIAFKSKKAYFPGPNYDFIGKYKDRWQSAGYGNITELFNVDIHPFNYLQPYPVPAPTNFHLIRINHVQKQIGFSWNNNAINCGAYYIARNVNNSGYVTGYAKICNPDYTWFYDYIQEGNSYKYKVRAMTCDTSGYSNEVTIPWYVAAPTMEPAVDMPPNQVRVSWQNNSNLTIVSYTLSRWNDVTNTWKDDYKKGLTTTFFDDTVTFLHKYKYRVKAQESGGHSSAWSNTLEYSAGMLAGSSYPRMSAFNNGAKVVRSGNNVYVVYAAGGKSIFCLHSTDNGMSWIEEYELWYPEYEYEDCGAGFPTIVLDNNGMPNIVWEQIIRKTEYYTYYYRRRYHHARFNGSSWSIKKINYFSGWTENDLTEKRRPPSFIIKGDSGFVAIQEYLGNSPGLNIIKFDLSNPAGSQVEWVAASDGFAPAIGYDPGGRLVVAYPSWWESGPYGDYGDLLFTYRRSNGDWADPVRILIDGYAGVPSLYAQYNKVYIAFHHQYNDDSVAIATLSWQGNHYDVDTSFIAQIMPKWQFPLVGLPSLVNGNLIVWRSEDDIWYSQRAGPGWTKPQDISNTPDVSSYPQGLVYGGGLRRKLFVLWTEKLGDDYYLVRKLVDLPPAYPNIREVSRVTEPEATGA